MSKEEEDILVVEGWNEREKREEWIGSKFDLIREQGKNRWLYGLDEITNAKGV